MTIINDMVNIINLSLMKYLLLVYCFFITINSNFAQTDKWCYDRDFYYKNFDKDTLICEEITTFPLSRALLVKSIFYDNNIARIRDIGTPVSETFHHFLCQHSLVNRWYAHYLKFNNEYFASEDDYIQKIIAEIEITYLGEIFIGGNRTNLLFLIKDGELYSNTPDFCYINRKILLINNNSTRIMSMAIMTWHQIFMDGYSEKHATYFDKSGNIHYKIESECEVIYTRKRDIRRFQKADTESKIVFTFDENGYLKIIKSWNGY